MPVISPKHFTQSSQVLGQPRDSQTADIEVNALSDAAVGSSTDTVAFTASSLSRQGFGDGQAVSSDEAQGILSSLRQAVNSGVDLFSAHYAPDPGRVAMLLAGAD